MGSGPLLTVPDKVTAMALSLLQCQIHPDHGLDLFLCVNLMFKSHSNFSHTTGSHAKPTAAA